MSRRKGETIKQYDLRRAQETADEQAAGTAHLREDEKFKRAMEKAGYRRADVDDHPSTAIRPKVLIAK